MAYSIRENSWILTKSHLGRVTYLRTGKSRGCPPVSGHVRDEVTYRDFLFHITAPGPRVLVTIKLLFVKMHCGH